MVDTNDTGPVLDPLVGTWVSEGSDLSDLFAGFPFEYQSIEANFRADGTVVTQIVDKDGAFYVTSGTYTIDASTTPASINLQQIEPYQAVLVGIYQVSGAELTYEVVQVQPDYGYIPPTPESGFGPPISLDAAQRASCCIATSRSPRCRHVEAPPHRSARLRLRSPLRRPRVHGTRAAVVAASRPARHRRWGRRGYFTGRVLEVDGGLVL